VRSVCCLPAASSCWVPPPCLGFRSGFWFPACHVSACVFASLLCWLLGFLWVLPALWNISLLLGVFSAACWTLVLLPGLGSARFCACSSFLLLDSACHSTATITDLDIPALLYCLLYIHGFCIYIWFSCCLGSQDAALLPRIFSMPAFLSACLLLPLTTLYGSTWNCLLCLDARFTDSAAWF